MINPSLMWYVVLHRIVDYLVLRPLKHLRDVSDAISRGNLTLRAELDTEDEFQEFVRDMKERGRQELLREHQSELPLA